MARVLTAAARGRQHYPVYEVRATARREIRGVCGIVPRRALDHASGPTLSCASTRNRAAESEAQGLRGPPL